MEAPQFHGLLVVDKQGGMTSRDVVNRAIGWFPRDTKLGHTGTLDPLATGVLVLTVGQATRLAEYVQRMAKTYHTKIRLGAVSDSDDADGIVTEQPAVQPPERADVERIVAQFVGTIEQVPPAISAAKVSGRRAYKLARQGHDVDLRPRPVTVHAINILNYAYPELELEVHCGKGTYIRSLARDIGVRLGCGGYVRTLRRTRVGSFEADAGITLAAEPPAARAAVLPLDAAVAELPHQSLPADAINYLCHGGFVPLDAQTPADATEVAVVDATGALALIADVDRASQMLRPAKVFRDRQAK